MTTNWPDDYIIPGANLYHQEEAGLIYLGDCRDILPQLPKVDLVLTDPPYGLGDKWQGGKKQWPLHHGQMGWDADTHESVVDLPKLAKCIIWGGHLYLLPRTRGWLIWDKIIRNFTSGHCEMAWTNIDQPIKAFSYSHGQLASENKYHPTQKPLVLMKWCLSFAPEAQIILDPFLGSGTTAVAAKELGRKFIGIEISEEYCRIAVKRLRQGVLDFG